MIIISRGWGVMALLIPLVFVMLILIGCGSLMPNSAPRAWMYGVATLLGGVVVFWWGTRLNGRLERAERSAADDPPADPILRYARSTSLSKRHSLYGIRMEYWGALEVIVGSILCLFSLFGA